MNAEESASGVTGGPFAVYSVAISEDDSADVKIFMSATTPFSSKVAPALPLVTPPACQNPLYEAACPGL